jgi:hypothetical protein
MSMSNPFSKPASVTGISWEDLNGRLLLVEPLEVLPGEINTSNGPQTGVVRATITVLDGDEAGRVYDETLIFPKVLKSQTRNKLGEMILARLGQGAKKPGQNKPWLLSEEVTEADVKLGTDFLASRVTKPSPATPAASSGTAAPWE